MSLSPHRPLVAAVAVLLAGPALHAQQTSEDLARRELITEAEAARDAGDHARALDLAGRAAAIRMSPSLALLLAQEHTSVAHYVEALSMATRCVTNVEADPTLHHRARLQTACSALVASLPARLSRLTVRLPSAHPDGLRVVVQGRELREALWGVAYPINPGVVSVEALAPDGSTFRQELTLASGESQSVEVILRAPTPTPTARPHPRAPTPVEAPSVPWRQRLPGRGPYIVLGAGLGTLGLAGLFYGLRELSVGARDDSAATVSTQCNLDPTQCNYTDAVDADGRARMFNLLANAAIGIGAVTLVSGVTWWVVSFLRGATPRPTPVQVVVVPSHGGAMFSLGGAL